MGSTVWFRIAPGLSCYGRIVTTRQRGFLRNCELLCQIAVRPASPLFGSNGLLLLKRDDARFATSLPCLPLTRRVQYGASWNARLSHAVTLPLSSGFYLDRHDIVPNQKYTRTASLR